MIYTSILLALIGLLISYYIHKQKAQKKTLMCPREANCEKVVHSTYATTLGIHNEVWGMAYYSVVITLLGLFGVAQSSLWVAILAVVTSLAVAFYVYLIFVQAFILRAWCLWCLCTALVNVGLVVIAWHLYGTLVTRF